MVPSIFGRATCISQLNSILRLDQMVFFCNEQKIKSIELQPAVFPLQMHI